jgi:tripartite-type tricarboxylate transporter receptor subunit TctC
MKLRGMLLALSLLIALLSHPVAGQEQAYPSRPITLIVVFAAGGPTDVMARIVSEHMSRTLGQQIVIENVAGAGGTTGGTRGARAAPDGYTLTVGSLGSHAAAPGLYKNMAFDPRELETIGMLAGTPGYVVVRKDFPAKTFAEFLTYAKANPGKITSGHAGVGSTPHLQCLLLASQAGLDLVYVPYRGSAPAMNDLVAGQIDSMCDLAPTVVPQVQSGTVRALLISMPERAATTPDVPTAAEVGLPEYLFAGWNAMFAPKGTPRPVIDRLSQALLVALADPGVQKRIADVGAIPASARDATPEALRVLLAAEIEKWKRILSDARVPGQ